MRTCAICGKEYKYNRKATADLCPICGFWSNVNKGTDDQCWLWKGKLNIDGYGKYNMTLADGKAECSAHRVAWIINVGPIPDCAHVLHTCDRSYPVGDTTNRRCVNPAHLKLGTHVDNMADIRLNGRYNHQTGDAHFTRRHPERLKRGDAHFSRTNPEKLARGDANGRRKHPELVPKGVNHPMVKLTEDQVLAIRSSKLPQRALARELGVNQTTISQIRRGATWRHLLSASEKKT